MKTSNGKWGAGRLYSDYGDDGGNLVDERIKKLKTPAECETVARHAKSKGLDDLVVQARQRAVELRASAYGATSDAERECLEAIYAYEETLRAMRGRPTRASRTWQMIQRKGIIPAIESVVDRSDAAAGFTALKEIGLENYAFEAVVLRHRALFFESAVARSLARMASLA